MVIGIARIYLSDMIDGGETVLKQVECPTMPHNAPQCPTMPHNAPQCPTVSLPERIYRDNDAFVC
jgi:hypothetical protein